MVPYWFLNFLNLLGPGYGHLRGPKLLPWDRKMTYIEMYHFEYQIQNFSPIGLIGQKLDVFVKMAYKSTALWPLKVMDLFSVPLLVLLQVW